MALITFFDIPRPVLVNLLDRAGKAEGISPRLLMGKPCELDPHQIAELYAGGFIELPKDSGITLTPAFVEVAQVILNPHTNVTFRIWGKEGMCGETNIQFPRDVVQGDGVMLNQMIDGNFRISAFIDDLNLTRLLGGALPPEGEEDLDFEFDGHFDAPVAAIFLGALDLARNHTGSGLRPGETVTDFVFSVQELYDYMFERWGFTAFKDLITYIVPAGMMAEAPSLSQTIDGLRSLAKAGVLIESKSDSFSLALILEPLVNLTVGLQAGMQWQRVSLMDSDELMVSNRLYLFGDKSFILCLAPTVEGKVFISRVGRQEITDFLLDEITATLTPSSEEPAVPREVQAPATPEMTCVQCGAILRPNAKHCSKCGARVEEQKPMPAPPEVTPPTVPEVTCAQCGAVLRPNAKFCSECGATAEERPPAPPKCPHCGETLEAGLKFCTRCGVALADQQSQPGPVPCPQRGTPLNPGAKFCSSCGTPI